MKKRLKKKMAQKSRYQGIIMANSNNGGDILALRDNMDGTVHLRVGSGCVMAIDQVVPVEFLTGIISQAMVDHGGDAEAVIDGFGWEQAFKDELKAKCFNHN